MSSTTGIQNLLVNVFRPVYSYDATTTLFTPKLEVSNVDTYSGNSVNLLFAAIGDSNNNVYVGRLAGNDPTISTQNCSNVTAVGYAAGSNISNVKYSVFVGANAGVGEQSASYTVSVGDGAGTGDTSVRIGSRALGTGNYNTVLGSLTNTAAYSNCILIGPGQTADQSWRFRLGYSNQTYLVGNISNKWLGIGTEAPYDTYNKLDVSGNVYVFGQQGINMVPIRTLDVNGDFRSSDSNGTLSFTGGVTTSTGGFASAQGTLTSAGIGSVTSIAPLKKGVVLVSAQDTANSTTHYAATMVYCSDATNGTYTAAMTSNVQSGQVHIAFQSGGSNIQISNATTVRNISWSVTYFQLP